MKTALIIVDVQNDFLPGGALAVPEGDQVVAPINQLLNCPFDLILASKDWHPQNHCSFAANHPGKRVGEHIQIGSIDQILWPIHCIENTPGSDFSPKLHLENIQAVFYKGTDAAIDSYSTLFDNGHIRSTGMSEFLKE